MNREIKFRAWRPKSVFREWHFLSDKEWYTRAITEDGVVMEIGDMVLQDMSEGIELSQFTGLLDKNWKEIYEGDVVTIEWWRWNMRVTWLIDGSFHITHVKKDEFLLRVSFLKNGCKIIGNIYENPELLTPKN